MTGRALANWQKGEMSWLLNWWMPAMFTWAALSNFLFYFGFPSCTTNWLLIASLHQMKISWVPLLQRKIHLILIIIIFIGIMSVSICWYIIGIMISYVWRRKKIIQWKARLMLYWCNVLCSIILDNLKSTPKVKWA